MSEAARTPGSPEAHVPTGGSLFSPAGSPNKALPPQFTSPNEKVVYEVEAGKLQRSLPAVAALAACRPGQEDPTRLRSSPTASPVLSLTEHTSCHKLPGRLRGVPVLHARIRERSFKSLFLQAQVKIDVQPRGCRTAAAEEEETETLSCLEKLL